MEAMRKSRSCRNSLPLATILAVLTKSGTVEVIAKVYAYKYIIHNSRHPNQIRAT